MSDNGPLELVLKAENRRCSFLLRGEIARGGSTCETLFEGTMWNWGVRARDEAKYCWVAAVEVV